MKTLEPIQIDIKKLIPFKDNPNVMSEEKFSQLVKEIEEEGFDEPLVVVKNKDDTYTVISGNHRLEACRRLGYKSLPCIVKKWDKEQQIIKSIRRNAIRGSFDELRFTNLVNELVDQYNNTIKDLPTTLGLSDLEFNDLFIDDSRDTKKKVKRMLEDTESKATQIIDTTAYIVQELLQKYGDTIPFGFIYFVFKKACILNLQMDTKLKELIDKVCKFCKNNKTDISHFLTSALELYFEALKEDERK